MAALEERIVDAVLAKFESLPARSKPGADGSGLSNWVPLSGIVISCGMFLRVR
jgi:hypothetical protein